MSKTFTTRPACQTRARAASRERDENDLNRSDRPGGAPSRGRGLKKVGTTRTTGARSRNMSSFPGTGQNLGRSTNTGQYENVGARPVEPQQENQPRRGTYAGGYTMYTPDLRKREQISLMAQRESQAYEQYKQANAVRHVSHIGAVGGGELTEEQVRARQANDVRAQRFNRQQKQEQQRQARRRAEDVEIEKMRAEAREKAERNAARAAQDTSAAEVRRKREAFLQQVENKSSLATASSSFDPAGPPHRMTQPSTQASFRHGSVFHASSSTPHSRARPFPKKTL